MPNLELLRERIDDSGMTVTAIADKAGILRQSLYNRLNGESEFKASEIVALTTVLRLSRADRDNIFLK